MLIASLLLALATAMGVYGWVQVMRGERRTSAQAELDMQVRSAIERVRYETRLSAIEKMVFHPAGAGPYQAISFPFAYERDEDGLVPMDATGTNILWDTTVVYHVDRGSPDRLLRTEFKPRNNDMSLAARGEQLATVVRDGDGSAACGEGEETTSRVVFANFFAWRIESTSSTFDAYADRLGRRGVLFGTAPIGPGPHTYTFTAVDRNVLSTGSKIGLDTLHVSASESDLEAEDQTIVASSPEAQRDYIAEGSWSGNHQLVLDPGDAREASVTLTIENDRWEETNFRGSGLGTDRVEVSFDPGSRDYVVQLTGKGDVWQADDQCGSAGPSDMQSAFPNQALRVLVRGETLDTEGYIRQDGRLVPTAAGATPFTMIRFRTHPGTVIENGATIARADMSAPENGPPRAIAGTFRELSIRAGDSGEVLYGVLSPSSAAALDINRTNSYVVSFRVAPHSQSRLTRRINTRSPTRVYTASVTNGASSLLWATSWSGPDTVTHRDVLGVEAVTTTYPAYGIYVSRVFDTTVEQPAYDTFSWSGRVPPGTAIGTQVRTGNEPDLSDAPAWSGVPVEPNPSNLAGVGFGRYVQFRSRLQADAQGNYTPQLGRVVIGWPGEMHMVDISAVATVGPDYGAYRLAVDGLPLVKGLRFDLEIFKDVAVGSLGTQRLRSSATIEVEPRNSGR